MQNYKDLRVWDKAHSFTLEAYKYSRAYPKEEMYDLTNQLRRCSSSIPANIAEGSGNNSQLEFAHFLNIALGSANEAEFFLFLSKDLYYLGQQDFDTLEKSINEIKAMLISLIAKVRS
jgi:four helix bundle protein